MASLATSDGLCKSARTVFSLASGQLMNRKGLVAFPALLMILTQYLVNGSEPEAQQTFTTYLHRATTGTSF
jgi:hypothetical protein